MTKSLLIGLLCLGFLACQAKPAVEDGPDFAVWPDLPIPRGFQEADHPEQRQIVEAGTFRSGDLAFEGTGPVSKVLEYYEERMPLFGWSWDPVSEFWTKGPNTVSLDVNSIPTSAYTRKTGQVRLVLSVRSQRITTQG